MARVLCEVCFSFIASLAVSLDTLLMSLPIFHSLLMSKRSQVCLKLCRLTIPAQYLLPLVWSAIVSRSVASECLPCERSDLAADFFDSGSAMIGGGLFCWRADYLYPWFPHPSTLPSVKHWRRQFVLKSRWHAKIWHTCASAALGCRVE